MIFVQVCSFMGKSYRSVRNELDRLDKGKPLLDGIVALDPAGPIFEMNQGIGNDYPLGMKLGERDAKVCKKTRARFREYVFFF